MATVEEFLTAVEVATFIKTQPETITNWAKQGIIPAIRINRRVYRYRLADVLAALEKKGNGNGGI